MDPESVFGGETTASMDVCVPPSPIEVREAAKTCSAEGGPNEGWSLGIGGGASTAAPQTSTLGSGL